MIMILKNPDKKSYLYKYFFLSMNHEEMGSTYSYFRVIAAAESGLVPPIDPSTYFDFEKNPVDAIRYSLDERNSSICLHCDCYSWKNEMSVMKHLADLCNTQLNIFSTSLEVILIIIRQVIKIS